MLARRGRTAVSSSLSYGLVVHLLLLPTTHHCVAVAFSYRPESVYLERTFTSLTIALSGAHPAHGSGRIVQVLSITPFLRKLFNPAHGSERIFQVLAIYERC
jgi:hypothetical protein